MYFESHITAAMLNRYGYTAGLDYGLKGREPNLSENCIGRDFEKVIVGTDEPPFCKGQARADLLCLLTFDRNIVTLFKKKEKVEKECRSMQALRL